MARPQPAHPDHASEQAYIEAAYRALEKRREKLDRSPSAAPDKVTARAMRKQVMARLQDPVDLDSICFGRIDTEDGKRHYLGRQLIPGEKLPLVINWQVPAAAPFYLANKADPHGLTARRRFQLEQLRLLGIIDERFAPAAEAEEVLEPPPAEEAVQPDIIDAILADMDRARGAEMRDIVATIEARQYELISDPVEGVLVIQGGPGSGKTAIALHRAAYLLFNETELQRSGVLVVGPNRAFMEYVSRVLPSLGETAVSQSAVDRLVDLPDVRVRGTENVEIERLKGDSRLAGVLERAVRARVRRPSEAVQVEAARISLAPETVAELIDEAWAGGRTYLDARDRFLRALVARATDAANTGRTPFGRRVPAGDIERAVLGPGGAGDRVWPTVTAPEVLRDLFASRQRLRDAADGALSDAEQELLRRERGRFIRDEPWTSADMPLLDEIDQLLRWAAPTYGYVLVDEAQDLSPMQLRMIMRRSPRSRATFVGDIAQSTGAWRYSDWVELLGHIEATEGTRTAELAIGYRVPSQIMELAAGLLPRIAPTLAPTRAVRRGAEDPRIARVEATNLLGALAAEVADRLEGDRTIGVIVAQDTLEAAGVALRDAGLTVGDILHDGLARQVTLLDPRQAKGLEFDHVVIAEPVAIAGPEDDWADVYVALTRATRTLSIVHSTEQPFERPPAPPEPAPLPETPVEVAAAEPVFLGPRFTEALMQAKFFHARAQRRGTSVPYFAHLQAVCALVLEDGGGEDEAIAALLHDAVEDFGYEMLPRIADQFGARVAAIVEGCTDPDADEGTGWRELKAQHLRDLETAGPLVRRVALAEKLDNARALLRDYRRLGDRVWERMAVDPNDLLWYQAALADLFANERPGDMADELRETVDTLLDLASEPALSSTE